MSDITTQAARDIRTLANALQLILEDQAPFSSRIHYALEAQIDEAGRIAKTLEAVAPAPAYLITDDGVEPCAVMGPSRNPPGNPGGEPEVMVQRSDGVRIWVHPFLVRKTSDEAVQLVQYAADAARDHNDDDAWLGHGKTIEQIVIERVAAQLRGTGD